MAQFARKPTAGGFPALARSVTLTPFHRRVLAEALRHSGSNSCGRLTSVLSQARLDLNPHQVEAAAFALDSLEQGGCLLADEVGLGKTIEAGLVMAQLLAEGKGPLIVICPATVCAQWQLELGAKLDVGSALVSGRTPGLLDAPAPGLPLICSFQFAARNARALAGIPWDLVVIDEAHHLRNAHRSSHRTGNSLRMALVGRPKILLTATPLQNNLMELFGLLSFLDDRILGPEAVFKSRYSATPGSGSLEQGSVLELKERLAGVVHRTLRRQVREYVRFTNRRSVVEDFTPTPEEAQLYRSVSGYLQRTDTAAIEPSRRTFLTLVYRKLLASSSFAIAPTLRKLADRLRGLPASSVDPAVIEANFEADDLAQDADEAEEWREEGGRSAKFADLPHEIQELESYAALAERIHSNAKGEALLRALDRTFTVARAHRWPEKAVVFTESKRTQAYLSHLLSGHGYQDKITLLSGDTGNAAERQAAIDEFREHSQILLSTDAGAEGLNLQFCNLVVNYDLPWNPQRIEQRIGRCHRYGQQRDVLVINFLNRSNAADARLFELLQKKLQLFDGVFGASDEILGALESGVDFERRILDIYQSCRLPYEIDAAFDALRADLERQIDQRMTQARSLLLDRFDGEVRRRLRLLERETQASLGLRREQARMLMGSTDDTLALSPRTLDQALEAGRAENPPPVSFLRLDPGFLPSKLAKLIGGEGWWLVYRFQIESLSVETTLIHIILIKEHGEFRALPIDEAEAFLTLPAQEEIHRRPAGIPFAQAHDSAWLAARTQMLAQAGARNALAIDRARERYDRFAEDCLGELRDALEQTREAWESARKRLVHLEDGSERQPERSRVERVEREYRKRLSALRATEEMRYTQKDREIEHLLRKAQIRDSKTLVASAYFWL